MLIVVAGTLRQTLLPVAAAATALLQGCSAVPAAKDAYDKGWRQARVVDASVGAQAFSGLVNDCRTQAPPGESHRFALMLYQERNQGSLRYVAAVPQGLYARAEHIFQVNVNDCNSPWYRVR